MLDKMLKIAVYIGILGLISLLYAFKIEPTILVTEEHTIQLSKQGEKGEALKVVQFSDTHLSNAYTLEQLEQAVRQINKEQADLVVFTGDLIDVAWAYDHIQAIAPILSQIQSKYGKFAVWGNHDYGGGGIKYYEEIMSKGGFVLLENSGYTFTVAEHTLNIIGLDDGLLGEPDIQKAIEGIDLSETNILLLHEPDLVEQMDTTEMDLVLAGHSHGGQVKIPFIGPLITPPLAEIYTNGMYTLGEETLLYVNTGLGTTRLPIRFLNPPTISVFTIIL